MLVSTSPSPAAAPQREPVAQPREHRHDVDLMRLVGSATVIFTHTSATLIHATDDDRANGPGVYWVGHIGDAMGAFAVPLFFAIAGWAVLVGASPRDEPRIWARIVRNSVPLFVWSLGYVAWAWLRDRNEDPTSDLAVQAFFGSIRPAYHLWFMYAYIPIMALLALMVLVRNGKHPWRLGLALLGVAAGPAVLATLAEVTGRDDLPSFGWGFGTYQMVYAVGGALLIGLPHRVSHRYRWALVATLLVSMAGAVWYDTTIHYPLPNAHLFVGVATICVILLLNRVRVPERWRPRLSRLAGAALGAYLVHVFFVEEVVVPIVSADLSAPLAALELVALVAVTLVLSYGASMLWGRLGLRRWLG
ncbi:acyltransferase [Streptomyces hainanensis]|uniref:Acyltransferase n=2 Tax=Streptomyces hainanensis TaxID=402648 RepID=A0A4R4T0N5_9ACTN|nr:acyltransferase [Streptomyces hainanensis]TDC68382.1 acyltransferase [Streptomyces hainanensis]